MSSHRLFIFGERLGLFLIVETAFLSTISTSFLLIFVARKAIRGRTDGDTIYFLNLMLTELIQAIGGMLNMQWIIDATLEEGDLCTTQGVLKQIGDVGVALTSLAIALHTFSVLILRKRFGVCVATVVVFAIWIFIALVVSIPHAVFTDYEGFGDSDYWCWIRGDIAATATTPARPGFTTERIALEYVWLWIAGGIMLLIYGIIASVMRGMIVIGSGSVHIKMSRNGRVPRDLTAADSEEERRAKAIANLMMFYPAVYMLCVFPVSLVRWLTFAGHNVPSAATFFAGILFSSSGLFNCILYGLTRPDLVRGSKTDREDIAMSVPEDKRLPSTTRRDNSQDYGNMVGYLPDDSSSISSRV